MTHSRTRSIPLREFSGQVIAIDGHNWAYTGMAVATKVVVEITNVGSQDPDRETILFKWFSSALELVCLFMSHGVTPLFIFDGTHLAEKAATQEKRRESRNKDKETIKELKEELRNTSPFDRHPGKIKLLKQLLTRAVFISQEEIERLKDLLQGIGIPVLQAKGDAEQLCSSLAREELVSGVYSEDTDNLVYGCPLLITSMGETYTPPGEDRSYRMATCVILSDVLGELEMTQEEFIEFCIMCGCDFNTRIFRLGPKTAYKLLKVHKKIDALPPNYDLTPLQYERCREIFRHTLPEVDNKSIQVDKKLLLTQGEEKLFEYGCESYYKRLTWHYRNLSDSCYGKIYKARKRRKITLN